MERAANPQRAQSELARRLRALRKREWPGVEITQAQLGQALGGEQPVSVPAISSWESPTSPRMPQPGHLAAYARFFATRRSIDDGFRLLTDLELTPAERARRDELAGELLALRDAALHPNDPAPRPVTGPEPSPLGEFWRMPDRGDITIVSSELSDRLKEQLPLADPDNPDYVKLYAYADLDALVELHGHVRALNPYSQVRFRLAREMVDDDYTTHLVLLGGRDWNEATRDVLSLLHLPVRQVTDIDIAQDTRAEEAYFEVLDGTERRQFRPVVEHDGDDAVILHEDIAHFYRGPNPFNVRRTVTICHALFGRGTLGAVRALTDARFRNRNEDYIRSRFPGQERFSILARVPVVRGRTVTPDWTRSDTRLHEWPQAAE